MKKSFFCCFLFWFQRGFFSFFFVLGFGVFWTWFRVFGCFLLDVSSGGTVFYWFV